MGNLVVNTLRVTGPAEDRERLKAAIEASATDRGEGAECLREYVIEPAKWREAFPEWGDWTVIGILESCYLRERANRSRAAPRSRHERRHASRPDRR